VVCDLTDDGEKAIPDHYTTRLLLQSLPLLLFPRFLAFLAYSGPQQDVLLTPLEQFMATNYALLLLATALCVVIAVLVLWCSPWLLFILAQFQTPSPSPLSDGPTTKIVTGHPMLVPLTTMCIAGAFISWNSLNIGSLGILLSLGNGIVGAWGFWTVRIILCTRHLPFEPLPMIHRCYLRARLRSHTRQGQTSTRQDFYSIIKPPRVLRRRNGRRDKRKCSLRGYFQLSFCT
jgi:hypothetical protein